MTDDLLEEYAPEIPAGYVRMNWFQGFGRQIGPLYERINDDKTYTRAFLVTEAHTNGMKNCHGGMLMAFADMALGHAISLEENRYWVTVRMVTDFVDAAQIGDWIEGTGRIAGRDDDIYTVTGRIWCGDRTVMTATGIFKALGQRPPKRKPAAA
jgi:acyl-coenzyme A thioesterase PaaI-like protein